MVSVAGVQRQIAMIEVFAGKFNDCAEAGVIPPFFWRLSLVDLATHNPPRCRFIGTAL